MRSIKRLAKEIEDYIYEKLGKEAINGSIILPKLEEIQIKGINQIPLFLILSLIMLKKKCRKRDLFLVVSYLLN